MHVLKCSMGHTIMFIKTINFQKITKKTDPVDSSEYSDIVEFVKEQLQGDSYSLDDEEGFL